MAPDILVVIRRYFHLSAGINERQLFSLIQVIKVVSGPVTSMLLNES